MKKKIILLSTIAILGSYTFGQSMEITSDDFVQTNDRIMNNEGIFTKDMIMDKNGIKMKGDMNFGDIMKNFGKMMNGNVQDFIKNNIKQIQQNWSQIHNEFGVLKDYINPDLSAGDKEKLTQTLLEMNKVMKDLKTEFRQVMLSGEDTFGIVEKIISTKKKFLDSIKPYVSEDMIDNFNEFASNWTDVKKENLGMRMENKEKAKDLKEKISKRKLLLNDKLVKMVETKLNAIPVDKKEDALNKILANLEKARIKANTLTGAKKDRMLNIIDEVEKIVREKLSGSDVDNEDETLVNKILNI